MMYYSDFVEDFIYELQRNFGMSFDEALAQALLSEKEILRRDTVVTSSEKI